MKTAKRYEDVFQLVQHEPQAKAYYVGLPDYVRGQVEQQANTIHTCDALHDFAMQHCRPV